MKNMIIVKRESLESELYQLEYLIKHFDLKLYPNGGGMTQFTTWLHRRKQIREHLSTLPTVESIQRSSKRKTESNSYSKEHLKLLAKMRALVTGSERG